MECVCVCGCWRCSCCCFEYDPLQNELEIVCSTVMAAAPCSHILHLTPNLFPHLLVPHSQQHIRLTISTMWNPNEIAKGRLISLCFQEFLSYLSQNLNNSRANVREGMGTDEVDRTAQWVWWRGREKSMRDERWVTRRKISLFINFIFVLLFYQNTFTHAQCTHSSQRNGNSNGNSPIVLSSTGYNYIV